MSKKLKSKTKKNSSDKATIADYIAASLRVDMSAIKPYAPFPNVPSVFSAAAKKFNRLRTTEQGRRARARSEFADRY